MPLRIRDPDTGEDVEVGSKIWREHMGEVEGLFDECTHPQKEIRKAATSDGRPQYRFQCLRCGDLVGSAVKAPQNAGSVFPADQGLKERYQAEKQGKHDASARRAIKREREFWAPYEAYLKSPEWRALADKVLRRANGMCEGCGERPATQVHHLTYEHVYREFLFDLVALCSPCHVRLHEHKGAA